MRLSSAFHLPAPRQPVAAKDRVEPAVDEAAAAPPAQATPGRELPDDLDARVRLIGEWQLGEG